MVTAGISDGSIDFKTPITVASVSFSVFLPDIRSSRTIHVRCLVESRVTIPCTCT